MKRRIYRFHSLMLSMGLGGILFCHAAVANPEFVGLAGKEEIIRESRAVAKLTSANTLKVVFAYVQSTAEYTPTYIAAYNASGLITPFLNGSKEDVVEIPEGTYDLMVVFDHVNADYTFGKEGSLMVIKENVEIKKDCRIVFDALEATNTIKMVAYTPDGEICSVPTCEYIDENWNKEIIEPGNIAETIVFKSVINRDFGRIYNLATNGGSSNFIPGKISKKKHNSDDYLAFHVNDVSDRYLFQQLRFMPTGNEESKSYIVTLRQLGSEPGEVRNDISSFFDIDESFVKPVSASQPRFPYSISFGMTENDLSPYCVGFSWANDNVLHLAVCPPPAFNGFENYQAQITFSRGEVNPQDGMEYAINSAPLRYSDSRDVMYYPVSAYDGYRLNDDGEAVVVPGPADLCFTPAQRRQANGSSVPVAVFSLTQLNSPFGPGVCPIMDLNYIGRLGERYNMQKALMRVTVTHDGSVIFDKNSGTLSDLGWSWNYPEGLVEIQAEVDANGLTDIQGKNLTSISFDQRNADKLPPILQMLQFRDSEGNVTDRFDKDNVGSVIISGGDFAQATAAEPDTYGEPVYYFEAQENPEIEVFYCAHGTDDMFPLQVYTIDNESPKPGFPAIWKGSLEEVEGKGWFDLQIKLTDAAGNSQSQLISPAFYISETTELQNTIKHSPEFNIESDLLTVTGETDGNIEIFSVNGILQMSTTDRQINIGNLPNGMYLLRISHNIVGKFIKH